MSVLTDLEVILSEGKKAGTLHLLKIIGLYFSEKELREIVDALTRVSTAEAESARLTSEIADTTDKLNKLLDSFDSLRSENARLTAQVAVMVEALKAVVSVFKCSHDELMGDEIKALNMARAAIRQSGKE